MNFIVQGYPAYVYTGGRPFDPQQPVLVFLHGAAMDHTVWQWQTRALAHRGFSVLAVDLPGHGRSPGWHRQSVEALAEWVRALLDAAGVGRTALIGHSLGSLVALESALLLPDRVSRLALLGCAVPMPVGEAFLAATRGTTADGIAMQALWGHAPEVRLAASPTPGSYLPNISFAQLHRAERGVQHASLAACNAYQPPPDRLATLACPSLVICGSRDLMTPARAGRALAAQLPGSLFETVSAGHSMMSETPTEVLRLLQSFLQVERLPSAAAPCASAAR
jgi:pimeloyl-ACP methyl ester carboxylesterase